MTRWLWLSVVIVVLDQLTKQLVELNLSLYDVIPLIPSLNLTLAYNEGAAFSFLSDQGGWQRWFFSGLALLVSLVLVGWLAKLKNERLLAVTLALIIGGAVGNLIDRVLFGHVIDFIDVYVQQWHWPAFNVADSAITIGVVLMFVDAFRGASNDSKAS